VRLTEQSRESGGTALPGPEKTGLTRGYVVALVSAAILSTTAIFIRYLTQSYRLPPLVLAFWRDCFVALSLLCVLGLLGRVLIRVRREHLFYLVMYGLTLAIFNALWTSAVSLIGAALSTVLVYCSAAFTALLGWWLLQERLDSVKLLAVALCLGGCFLVSGALDQGAWHASLLGVVAGTVSGLCYSVYSLMGRSASQRGLNPWTTVLYAFGFAAFFLFLFNLLPAGVLPGFDTGASNLLWLGDALGGWAILFLLAAGPTLAGYGLYNVSLGYLPSSVANLILTVEPIFTAALAYVLLGERLGGMQLAGSLMILGGVVFLRVHEGRLPR
jgi:drug/metabolite transporter (DMT)-like permease